MMNDEARGGRRHGHTYLLLLQPEVLDVTNLHLWLPSFVVYIWLTRSIYEMFDLLFYALVVIIYLSSCLMMKDDAKVVVHKRKGKAKGDTRGCHLCCTVMLIFQWPPCSGLQKSHKKEAWREFLHGMILNSLSVLQSGKKGYVVNKHFFLEFHVKPRSETLRALKKNHHMYLYLCFVSSSLSPQFRPLHWISSLFCFFERNAYCKT